MGAALGTTLGAGDQSGDQGLPWGPGTTQETGDQVNLGTGDQPGDRGLLWGLETAPATTLVTLLWGPGTTLETGDSSGDWRLPQEPGTVPGTRDCPGAVSGPRSLD